MDIKYIVWDSVDWIDLAQDRDLVNKRRTEAAVIPNAEHRQCAVYEAVLFTRGGNKCEAGHKNSTAHNLEKLKSRRFRIGVDGRAFFTPNDTRYNSLKFGTSFADILQSYGRKPLR
jgi:hypothetical protein